MDLGALRPKIHWLLRNRLLDRELGELGRSFKNEKQRKLSHNLTQLHHFSKLNLFISKGIHIRRPRQHHTQPVLERLHRTHHILHSSRRFIVLKPRNRLFTMAYRLQTHDGHVGHSSIQRILH